MASTSLDLSQIKTDALSAASTFRTLIGLGNVNNTSDANKPISSATQSALDGKLSLTGGTLTGAVTSNLGTITASTPALTIDQTWNNAAVNFSLINGSITPTAASGSYWFNFTSTSNWGAGGSPFFRASARDGAIEISSMWGQGSLLLGSHAIRLEGIYGTGFVIKDYTGNAIANINTEYSDTGIQAERAAMPIGWSGLKLRRDAADTLALQRSTNAQRFNLYGTYTDASNYRRLYLSSTTAGAFTIGVEGAGTGASGNTLNIAGNTGIGTSSPNVALVIRRSGADLPALRLEDGDITVPFTGIGINPTLNANTVGSWSSSASASGGMSFSGFTNNTAASYPLIFEGYTGSASPTKSIISFSGWKTNGGTGATTLASSELLAGFFNGDASGTPVVSIAANGAITAAAGTFSGGVTVNSQSGYTLDNGYGSWKWVTGNNVEISAPYGLNLKSRGLNINTQVAGNSFESALSVTTLANTNLPASTEATDVNFNLARTVQFAAGNITTQRAFRIQAPTYSFASASTITTASTLSISGAPVAGTNATITNRYALNVEGGVSRFGGSLQVESAIGTFGIIVSGNNVLFDGGRKAGNGVGSFLAAENGSGYVFDSGWGGIRASGGIGLSNILTSPYAWTISCGNTYAVEIGNGGNSQILRLYNTYTDASNYIRQSLSFTTYSTTVHAQLAAEGAGTGAVNIPFVITPRGTGAFILGPMPDGTATGGNARGANAIDLQTTRSAATQVASGLQSIAIGSLNRASTSQSIAIGYGNAVTGLEGKAIGYENTVTAPEGNAIGLRNTVSNGDAATCIGDYNTASEAYCLATGGRSFASRWGQRTHACGNFADIGDAQRAIFILRIKTTNNTATTIMLDGSSRRLTIPSGKLFLFTAKIVGVRSDGLRRASYVRKGTIINVAGATSIVGAIEAVGTDVEDDPNLNITITADDTNDALDIQVTGITGETWRWVAVVEGVEVAYGT